VGRIGRAIDKTRALWLRVLREHASPREIGCAVGVGVFAGCTPIVGLHGVLAVALATALRLNKLWAFLGSRVSNLTIFPWIVLAEVQIAHRVRTGAWVAITVDDVLAHGKELLLDWLLGMIPVGGALAVAIGGMAYLVARFKARRTRAPRPPPSSGSSA